jgi:hypothetical protein
MQSLLNRIHRIRSKSRLHGIHALHPVHACLLNFKVEVGDAINVKHRIEAGKPLIL